MTLVDFHNHTSLCGHATGTVDEYIAAAIKCGIRDFGFSDHAPLPHPIRESVTMTPDETEMYIEMINAKRAEYADRINIKVGFEVDFPLFDSLDRRYLTDPRLDYLIGSCHFLEDWPFDHPDYIDQFSKNDINDLYVKYYTEVEELIDTRLFQIIGHFDLLKKFGHRATINLDAQLDRMAKKIAVSGIAVELNTAGLRKPVKEIYPAKNILEILFRNNAAVTLGSDSHAPDEVGAGFDEAIELLHSVGYKKLVTFNKRQRSEVDI